MSEIAETRERLALVIVTIALILGIAGLITTRASYEARLKAYDLGFRCGRYYTLQLMTPRGSPLERDGRLEKQCASDK